MAQLGSLREVSLREAWDHEAHSFTPWLAKHLDLLADALGVPLELEDSEVAVGGFSADILARNPLDDTLVLIENQLEKTDHTHLCQIMTYLAGLEAHTIVWVAAEFREEHLSAMRWLNEHTTDPFAFFAVRVKVVRIDDSPPAPVFEVLERPNQWERRLHEVARPGLTEVGQRRLEFWTRYIERFPDEGEFAGPGGNSTRWHVLGQYELIVSFYFGRDGVGIFIRGRRGAENRRTISILEPVREQLADATGSTEWSEETGHFFNQTLTGDTSDPNSWDEMCDWLHETTERYERALHACFGEQS